MDHANVSLEDLIKKDRGFKKGGPAQRGGRFGGNNFRGAQRGGEERGNQVPRFRERAGIFKQNRGEIELPPRASQGGQALGSGAEGPRMKRVR